MLKNNSGFRKNLFFVSIILIIFILFIEGGTNFYNSLKRKCKLGNIAPERKDASSPYRLLKRNYTQYSQARFYPSEDKQLRINSLGFRGKEFTIEKPADVYRIIILGGSTAFGWGASCDNTTFAAVLERLLNESSREKQFEVYDMAVPGYISSQELITLQFYGIDFKPDLVIDLNGFNDLLAGMDDMADTPADIDEHSGALIKAYKLFWESPFWRFSVVSLGARLKNWSSFFRTACAYIELRQIKRYYNDPKNIKRAMNRDARIDFYLKNLDTMSALAAHYNFQLIVVLQPVLIYKNHLTAQERELLRLYSASINQNRLFGGLIKSYFPVISSRISELSRKSGKTNFLDFSVLFQNSEEDIFLDMAHLTDKGNEILAQELFKQIKRANF